MLVYIFFYVLPLCSFVTNGGTSKVPEESSLESELLNANKLDLKGLLTGSKNVDDYHSDLQRRNLELHPEWLSHRIRKLVAKGYTHNNAIPLDHRRAAKDDVPTPKTRRSSLYGLTGRNPIIVADDIGDSGVAPQPIANLPAGSELVDLPSNYQALTPDAFHDLSFAHSKYINIIYI